MNFITTSRKPGINARLFAKDIASILSSGYLTRGKAPLSDLIATARYNGATKLFIVTEYAGNPKQILEISVLEKSWEFSNTYFVTLHKLRKTFTTDKFNVRDMVVKTEQRAIKHLLKGAGIKPGQSDFTIKDVKNDAISVFKGTKEIGPRFDIFYKEW